MSSFFRCLFIWNKCSLLKKKKCPKYIYLIWNTIWCCLILHIFLLIINWISTTATLCLCMFFSNNWIEFAGTTNITIETEFKHTLDEYHLLFIQIVAHLEILPLIKRQWNAFHKLQSKMVVICSKHWDNQQLQPVNQHHNPHKNDYWNHLQQIKYYQIICVDCIVKLVCSIKRIAPIVRNEHIFFSVHLNGQSNVNRTFHQPFSMYFKFTSWIKFDFNFFYLIFLWFDSIWFDIYSIFFFQVIKIT